MAGSEFLALTPALVDTVDMYSDQEPPPVDTSPPDSWTPVDLSTLPNKPPVPPTLGGVGLVYPGLRHVFSGPPESAKTLAAYAILIHVVRDGGTVALIDFEMGAYDTRARLRELGATQEELARILYIAPDEPATPERIDRLAQHDLQLVIIDAAAGAYSLQGLDDEKRLQVEQFATLYVQPFWRVGTATIIIDHVVKNSDDRGRYSIGSERKLGVSDVALGFDIISPVSRGTSGRYKIVTNKDRGAYLKRGHVADLHLESDPDTHQITWAFRPATDQPLDTEDGPGYFRPTGYMEKVSRILEAATDPMSRNAVAEVAGGTREYVFKAIFALATEGYIGEGEGANRSRPVHSIRPFREADQPIHVPGGSVVRSGSAGGSETTETFGGSGGSAVVREPQMVSGSVVRPPYGGSTTRTDHLEPPNTTSGSEPPEPAAQLGWFGTTNGTFTDSEAAYLGYLETITPDDTPNDQ